MTDMTLTDNATPRKSAYAEYFEQKHALELRAYALHPCKVELLEAAFEATLEALEARDWGQFPENMELTRRNFIAKFDKLTGEEAYRFCLTTKDTYFQR